MAGNDKLKIKRRWIILLLIAVLVIFATYILFAYQLYKLSKAPEVQEKTREYLLLECSMKPGGYFRDDCYEGVARLYRDTSICDRIANDPNDHHRAVCYEKIALMTFNISICDMIEWNYSQDLCYEEVAEALQDPVLCERIKNHLSFRDDCYANIAPGLGDADLCEKIRKDSVSIWESCIENVAMHNKDPAICDRLGEGADQAYCLIRLAEEIRDPSVCERVLDQGHKDHCYHKMSQLLKDKSLCKKIKAEHKKKICES